jgi:tetratricopeptide (TPR) repeat protein
VSVVILAASFVIVAAPANAAGQSESPANLLGRLRQLAAEQRWAEIVHEVEHSPERNAEVEYQYGSALAQLGRLEEAGSAFLAGQRLAPGDKRFPTELAGVAFKQKRLPEAARLLRRALRLDPADTYANDFLGTVYFLQHNLEAALLYWNRIGKPFVERVQPDADLRVRPALLDRALTFAPASEMRLRDLATTQLRLEGLEVFANPQVRLAARSDGKFDAVLNFEERNGFGGNAWQALLGTFGGVAYQTIYPAYFNLGGSGTNITSLVRWDAQKRRLRAELSGPLQRNPRWRYRVDTDLRNENWDIHRSFTGNDPSLASLNLRREAGSVSIDSFNSGRWGWWAGGELSHRDYRSIVSGSTLRPALLLSGYQLKQIAGIRYALLHAPEYRFTLDTTVWSQLGRIWSTPGAHTFEKVQGSLNAQWFPQAQGEDYATRVRILGGGTAGTLPFDELFMLGMERDNDLWMRAHVGTRDGRKGSAPLGDRYVLINSEMDKDVYSNGLIGVKLGPFLDSGKITDSSGHLGAPKWMWDTGAQLKLGVLGVELTFVYGKDLRTGNNAFYFTAGRR